MSNSYGRPRCACSLNGSDCTNCWFKLTLSSSSKLHSDAFVYKLGQVKRTLLFGHAAAVARGPLCRPDPAGCLEVF